MADRPDQMVFCARGGYLVNVDLGDPSRSGRIHRKKGGIARIAIGPDGKIHASCNDGALLQVRMERGAWVADTLFRDVHEGRGVVVGRFPIDGRLCTLAAFGYARLCRLFSTDGIGWDTRPLFRDTDRAHWMVAADVIPDNGADELLLGGYSGNMTLLTHVRR